MSKSNIDNYIKNNFTSNIGFDNNIKNNNAEHLKMGAQFSPNGRQILNMRTFSEYLTRKQKMVAKRRGKRKSPAKGYVFEVNEEDVSPDNSDNDFNEPEAKLLKTDSKFVESVVAALSNLENETETKSSNSEILDDVNVPLCENDSSNTQNLEENSSEISGSINPNAKLSESETEKSQVDFEDGELAIENVDENDTSTQNQTIQINFSTREVSSLYKSKFLKFISSFVELEIVKENELSINLKRNLNQWRVLDETGCIDISLPLADNFEGKSLKPLQENEETSPNVVKSSKKKKKKRGKKEKELFVLDTMPSQQNSSGCAKYMSKFNIDINDDNGNEEEIKISNQICFNCDQDHALRDCPAPKNYVKINMMRQKFKKDKQSSRYHLEEEQKYAHLSPGKISEKLKEALGLKKNQLPPYLYQMRTLGYPPGWLEEAKFVYSNLSLFDSDGNNVKPENMKKNQGLDASKIVEYPGFNIPMEKDCNDEYRHYGVPPYSENYSKTAMIEYFEREYSKQQDDFVAQDMDIDANEEVGCKKLSMKMSPIKEMEKNVASPSLVDLETQKQSLLDALGDSDANLKPEHSTNDVPSSEPENIKEPSPPGEEIDEPLISVDAALSEMFPDKVENATDVSEDKDSSFLRSSNNKNVLNSTFGTPILKSSSPYSSLPNPDNFMKDVSPVINFENLPNSTGKYEQMTGILQKVRNTMKNLQNCDST